MCECLAKSLGCPRASASPLSEELGRQGTAEGRHWEENWQKDHGDPQAGYLGKGSGFKLQGKELGPCSILKETEVLPELGAPWREEGVGMGTAGGGLEICGVRRLRNPQRLGREGGSGGGSGCCAGGWACGGVGRGGKGAGGESSLRKSPMKLGWKGQQ